ncbi:MULTISPECIES: hypothetical protein [unclassified Tenacibaculum]|uniref:hypothetical protein n=1 Tax=unclassified Tenacibaculum TaxID=2635139 RepID=UPI001F2F093D|nr:MULTISPECIES: hypothetical protein [unclassified Tenacibaculum]MCF2875931.1 hypothetical protein [Tenacibaculum sp. Cn5-1]MCF2936006.1 hypothetical protein [Tenacibaculum sp. Cn5-34]MCG7512567.1 hypothetical protein [Tenacibaculum sp. Cn5-46]
MIVGNKESFAVEFTQSESDPKMGFGKIWIQNDFLGTNKDLIYFQGYLISLLNELINAKEIEFEFDKLSESELFERFENKQNRFDYLIEGSTFTDDFIAYRFNKNGKIYLIWKMWNDKEILFSDLKDYGTNIKFCSTKKIEIETIKNELLKKNSIQPSL